MAITKVFNGKRYSGFGTYYTSKRSAQAEAKRQRDLGRPARVVKLPKSLNPPDRPRSLQHYQVYVRF